MPLLLPGVLELTLRARYLSFFAFCLDEFRARHLLPLTTVALGRWIKRWEWDYGLAVLHCPNDCGSVPIGAQRLRPVNYPPGGRALRQRYGRANMFVG